MDVKSIHKREDAEEMVKKATENLHGEYKYGRGKVKGTKSDLIIRPHGARGVSVENKKSGIHFNLSPVKDLVLPEDGARFITRQNQEIQLFSGGTISVDLFPSRLERRISVIEEKLEEVD